MLTFIPGWNSLEKEEGGFHLLMAAIIQSRFLPINPAVNIPFLSPCQSIFFQQSKTSIFLKFSPSLSDWEKTPIFFSHESKVGVWVEGKSNTGRSRKSNKQVPKRHGGFYGAEGICCPQMEPGISVRSGELWKRKAPGFWQEGSEALQRMRVQGLGCGHSSFQAVQCCSSDSREGEEGFKLHLTTKLVPGFGMWHW